MITVRRIKRSLVAFFFLSLAHFPVQAEVVLEHDSISVDRAELDYVVSLWPAQMQQAAANDEGDRLELLNRMLVAKKLAREADNIPADSELYWPLQYQIMNLKQKYWMDNFNKTLDIPEMTALAKERYATQKDEYARVPEQRLSSHILFACPPGECSRVDTTVEAQEVLDQLRAGADFAAMVQQHSDDTGTKVKDGLFDVWISRGQSGVSGHYTEGLYTIDNVGDYSEPVNTRFGIHILRLDDIREEHYLPYEAVEPNIVKALRSEYVRLSTRDYLNTFDITEDVYIDRPAVEGALSPYKTASP
ncbi:peptidylprolyl isomerase [Candidatus Marimicrobium litorale]|nr:peptidylprolyl isomerase [Candidatus Marimicrobium litorale]